MEVVQKFECDGFGAHVRMTFIRRGGGVSACPVCELIVTTVGLTTRLTEAEMRLDMMGKMLQRIEGAFEPQLEAYDVRERLEREG